MTHLKNLATLQRKRRRHRDEDIVREAPTLCEGDRYSCKTSSWRIDIKFEWDRSFRFPDIRNKGIIFTVRAPILQWPL